jgi:DNA-binding NarL/FixJ family response regulator
MGSTPIRVFVVDDHELIRQGLRRLIEREDDIELAGEAETAAEALARVPDAHPHVVILDMRLPDGDGVRICREIRSRAPNVQCLMFTSFSDEDALFDSIMAGAAGYLLKQTKGADLLDAIRTVAAGRSLLDPETTQVVLGRIRDRKEASPAKRLTPQEQRILDLIAEGMTNRQIGQRLRLTEKTVKNYVSNVLDKLDLESRTQAAVYVVRQRKDER